MATRKMKIYWIFLLLLMYTGSLVLGVGEAQARYESTAISTTVLEAQHKGIISDCMVREGDPAVTVLLGELDKNDIIKTSFWLKSVGADAEGEISWGLAPEDHEDYADFLKISMRAYDEFDLEPNENIQLLSDEKMELTLTIQPTSDAISIKHDRLTLNVFVTWNEEMWGTFQVILPAVEGPAVEEQAEDSSDSEAENGTDTSADPDAEGELEDDASGNPENESESGDSEDADLTGELEPAEENSEEDPHEASEESVQEENSLETAQINSDPESETDEDSAEEETDSQEENLGTQESDAIANGEMSDNTEDPDYTGTSDGMEEDENTVLIDDTNEIVPLEDPVTDEPELQLKTLPYFNPNEKLPVFFQVTDDITSVRLGTQLTVDEEECFLPFPDRTRFSLDGGHSYYMMDDGLAVEFMLEDLVAADNGSGNLQVSGEILLLMDFSYAKLRDNQPLTLVLEVYNGDALQDRLQIETMSKKKDCIRTSILPVVETETVQENTQQEAVEPEQIRYDERILNRDYYMELELPVDWEDVELEYSVERLTMNQDGDLEYRTVTLSDETLSDTYTKDDEEHTLELKIGKKLPQAGTYRLNMNWNYKGVCFKQTQTTFFINYSGYLDKDLGSQGVQTND